MPPFARHGDGRPDGRRERLHQSLTLAGGRGSHPLAQPVGHSAEPVNFTHTETPLRRQSGLRSGARARQAGSGNVLVVYVRLCCLPGAGSAGSLPSFLRHLQDRTAPAAKTGSRTRFAPEDHYRLPWFRVAGINGDEKNHAARRKRGCESFRPLATSRPAAPSSQPCLSSRPRKRARSNGPGMTRWAAFSAKKPNRS